MYSTYNEGKSERVIRTLKDKVFKHITAVLKNIYFDMLDDFLNKWNNTVHRTIKMKPIDVISDSYAQYNENSNGKYLKCKTGDHVRVSKYKNIFAKGYTQNWLEETFVVSKIKNAVPWTYAISDLNIETISGMFYEKELQKTNQKEFRIEKMIKRKADKMYIKGKDMTIRLIVGLIKKILNEIPLNKNESVLS